ncbi:hypothetical protein K0M31_012042 [Melipona bicolor]|uniref:Uncharacterized protein n=1 Tax=Melipona bicolor TaxID=60889 RepID=A0AA40GAR4_9HYME|nr:hypothetical protein K0M31_012042 [Melipona bicolor]
MGLGITTKVISDLKRSSKTVKYRGTAAPVVEEWCRPTTRSMSARLRQTHCQTTVGCASSAVSTTVRSNEVGGLRAIVVLEDIGKILERSEIRRSTRIAANRSASRSASRSAIRTAISTTTTMMKNTPEISTGCSTAYKSPHQNNPLTEASKNNSKEIHSYILIITTHSHRTSLLAILNLIHSNSIQSIIEPADLH